jgi:hypothetical protein
MKRPFYPLLLSIYPVLALLAANITQIKMVDALRALLVLWGAGALLFLGLKLLLRDSHRAALVFSILWILFFSYGHVYSFLECTPIFGLALGRHRLLLPLWAILLVAGLVWALTSRLDLTRLSPVLNTVVIVLLVMPVLQIGLAEGRQRLAYAGRDPRPASAGGLQVEAGQTPPDIYYIILDAYARGDVLQDTFGYDNSAFLDELERLGFYVAECSQSNYAQTELSLASSLNFAYLETLDDSLTPESNERAPLRPLLQDSAARHLLEDLGYQTVAFETGYSWSQLEDADIYLAPASRVAGLNGFEALLVKTSAGLALIDAAAKLPDFLVPDVNYPNQTHRQRVLFTLEKLAELPDSVNSPKFVFAHIVAPHEPFVFDAQGQMVTLPETLDEATYRSAYRDEVIYLNQRVGEMLREIIDRSATPPVIILQADHGHVMAAPEQRMQILNAYYLPGGEHSVLYPQITPVNTIRLIFNRYFGGQLDLLEDHSYYSVYETPFQFEQIPNDCQP